MSLQIHHHHHQRLLRAWRTLVVRYPKEYRRSLTDLATSLCLAGLAEYRKDAEGVMGTGPYFDMQRFEEDLALSPGRIVGAGMGHAVWGPCDEFSTHCNCVLDARGRWRRMSKYLVARLCLIRGLRALEEQLGLLDVPVATNALGFPLAVPAIGAL